MSAPPRAAELGVIACHACGLVCERPADHAAACPRCGAALHRRKANSLARAWAYLIAGAICYVPANLLPVTYTTSFGNGFGSTIVGGVLEFWEKGAWDIAVIIFVASIVVPSVKFGVLGMLLYTAGRRSAWARRERARLYRLVELIGYWSMLDVVVVALVAALVQFHALSSIEPRSGIFYFGMVVVFTMLSAISFEPRLIWDDEDEHGIES